jgi:hypothetical protein
MDALFNCAFRVRGVGGDAEFVLTDLCDTLDEVRDIFTEPDLHLLARDLCIFEDIVHKTRADGVCIQSEFREYLSGFGAVRKIGFPGFPLLPLVRRLRETVATLQKFDLCLGIICLNLVH